MNEPLTDLASAVFHVRLHPDYPTPQQKEWYGQAIRAIFLRAINKDYSPHISAEMHKDHELRAYTVSNLIPALGSEDAGIPHEFTFYINVCQKESLLALLHCTLPGNQLAPGSHINLSGLHCQIINWNLCDRATYSDLSEMILNRKSKPCQTINLRFESPVYFKDTKTAQYTAQLTPVKVFGSLLSKWMAFASVNYPEHLRIFLQDHVFINTEKIAVVKLNANSPAPEGSVGLAHFISDRPKDPDWSFIRCLARFADFAGVGKDTAIGFGRTHQEGEKVTSASIGAKK